MQTKNTKSGNFHFVFFFSMIFMKDQYLNKLMKIPFTITVKSLKVFCLKYRERRKKKVFENDALETYDTNKSHNILSTLSV